MLFFGINFSQTNCRVFNIKCDFNILPDIMNSTPAMKVQSRRPLTQWPSTQQRAPNACVSTASSSGAAERVTTSEIIICHLSIEAVEGKVLGRVKSAWSRSR